MNDHDAFLRKILENPADDGPRLAYADWLEERGELERAEFLRVEHLLTRLPPEDRRRAALRARLEDLAASLVGLLEHGYRPDRAGGL